MPRGGELLSPPAMPRLARWLALATLILLPLATAFDMNSLKYTNRAAEAVNSASR